VRCAKTPGGWQGENDSRHGSSGCCGQSAPSGAPGSRAGKIPEADGGGRAALDPGLRRKRCRVGARLESEGKHLVLLVANVQREVMQGAANDGVGAVVKQLERRYVAVPPPNTVGVRARSSGSCGGSCWVAVVLCLVEVCSAALSVLENCSRKIFEGNSGESKNWPDKISGEPNTA
jgi:hypothetical protein